MYRQRGRGQIISSRDWRILTPPEDDGATFRTKHPIPGSVVDEHVGRVGRIAAGTSDIPESGDIERARQGEYPNPDEDEDQGTAGPVERSSARSAG